MLDQKRPYFFNACKNNRSKLALIFMKNYRNECNPSYMDGLDNTALLWACRNKMTNTALKIIRYYGLACRPSHENIYKSNALRYACKYNLKKVAFSLIDTFGGACNPECMGMNRIPSFMLACKNKMDELASHMLIIYANRCMPGYVSVDNNTALIWACKNKLKTTIMLLLCTYGDSCNIYHIDDYNKTAFDYANDNGLSELVSYLYDFDLESSHRQIRGQLSEQILEQLTDLDELNIELLNELFGFDDEYHADNNNENIILPALGRADIPSIPNNTDVRTDTNNNITLKCVVCFDELVRLVLLKPCNHICMCEICTARIKNGRNICPICRTDIFSTEQVYISQ